jgi:hypothetical protein
MKSPLYICIELFIALGLSGVIFLALLFHPTIFWIVAGTLYMAHFILVIRYSHTHFSPLLIVSFLVPLIFLIYPFYLEMNTNSHLPNSIFISLVYYFLGLSLLLTHLFFNRGRNSRRRAAS